MSIQTWLQLFFVLEVGCFQWMNERGCCVRVRCRMPVKNSSVVNMSRSCCTIGKRMVCYCSNVVAAKEVFHSNNHNHRNHNGVGFVSSHRTKLLHFGFLICLSHATMVITASCNDMRWLQLLPTRLLLSNASHLLCSEPFLDSRFLHSLQSHTMTIETLRSATLTANQTQRRRERVASVGQKLLHCGMYISPVMTSLLLRCHPFVTRYLYMTSALTCKHCVQTLIRAMRKTRKTAAEVARKTPSPLSCGCASTLVTFPWPLIIAPIRVVFVASNNALQLFAIAVLSNSITCLVLRTENAVKWVSLNGKQKQQNDSARSASSEQHR